MPPAHQPASLDGLVFAAHQLVDGLYAGRHASPLRGSGVEFHDYRAYSPGDDLRAIDWKVFGRTDRYYLKRFRHETDLNLHLAIDASASMAFTGLNREGKPANAPSKFALAQQLAAAIAMLVVRQGDRVGLALLDTRVRERLPASGSAQHLRQLIAKLHNAAPNPGQANLADALAQLQRSLTRRGVVLLISDLLDEPENLLASIDRVRFAGSEVVVFQILTPSELDLSGLGDRALRMADPESWASTPTRTARIATRYRQLMHNHLDTLKRQLTARNCDHLLIRSDRPLIDPLREYLTQRTQRLV